MSTVPEARQVSPEVAAHATPKRVKLSRRKGYRKPEGAVVVARPSKWGNPIRWKDYPDHAYDDSGQRYSLTDTERRGFAVAHLRSALAGTTDLCCEYPSVAEIRAELADRDLCCWCPADQPCHADVLLELANGGEDQ